MELANLTSTIEEAVTQANCWVMNKSSIYLCEM